MTKGWTEFNSSNAANFTEKRARQEDEKAQEAYCRFKRLRIDNENILSCIPSQNNGAVINPFETHEVNNGIPGQATHHDPEVTGQNRIEIQDHNRNEDGSANRFLLGEEPVSVSMDNTNKNVAQHQTAESSSKISTQECIGINHLLGNLHKDRLHRAQLREASQNDPSNEYGRVGSFSETSPNQYNHEVLQQDRNNQPKIRNQQSQKKRTINLYSHSSLF